MGFSIKNRIFGSDLPENIKAKIKLRQLYAYSSKPNESLQQQILNEVGTSAADLGALSDFVDSNNLPTINHLSARTPFARMWTGVGISTERYVKVMDEEEAELWEKEKYKVDGNNNFVNLSEFKDLSILKLLSILIIVFLL